MYIKKSFLFGLVFAGLSFLVGCTTVITILATAGLPKSDYIWFGNDSFSYRSFIEKMGKIPSSINADDYGSHFVEVDGNMFGQMMVSVSSESFLRNSFKNSTGLLEPVYRINENGDWIYDRQTTKAVYDFLIKTKFRVLPIEKTDEIAQRIEKFIFDSKSKINFGFIQRDARFFDAVLNGVVTDTGFYIHDGSLTDYVRSKNSPSNKQHAGLIVRNINYAFRLTFIEAAAIKQGMGGNFSVPMNGAQCGSTDIKQFTSMLDQIGRYQYIPLAQVISDRNENFEYGLKFCNKAFELFKLTKKIESQRL